MKKLYDSGYKYIFSHKGFVQQLLKNFVKGNWVKRVDFNQMEKVNASFVRKNYAKRESDIIWKCHYQNEEVYIYILIEFQSKVDKWMSLRILSYVIDFYEDIIKHQKTLPVIFPIMIYNGEQKWTAVEEFEELIEETDPELRQYLPKFKYFKIVINEFEKRSLIKLKNLLASLFLIENSASEKELEALFEQIIIILQKELDNELKEAFINWFKRLEDRGKVSILEDSRYHNIDELIKKEGKPMLTKTLKKIRQDGRKEGRNQEKLFIAQQLHRNGMDLAQIEQITGLTLAEIKNSLNQN